jgi:hypothetical protein
MILSILVPTKNNHDLISNLVRGFKLWSDKYIDDIEMVIVDNSSKRNQLFIDGDYANIRYLWSDDKIDALENFDRCILQSRGEYSCIIGDDDTILPTIISVVLDLLANNVDAAMGSLATYYWPGVNSYWVDDNQSGYLEIPYRKSSPKIIDIKSNLTKVLNEGGCSYKNYLPSAYHSIVRTSMLRSLIKEFGTAFPGPSPDISNAILLANKNFKCKKYEAFVISGARAGSAAAEGAMHKHHGLLENRSLYLSRGTFKWPNEIPRIFCGPTMWGVSVIHTLKFTGRKNELKLVNKGSLMAYCIVFHPQYFKEVFISLRGLSFNENIRFMLSIPKVIFKRSLSYIFNMTLHSKLFSFMTGYKIYKNIPNTEILISKLKVP